MTDTIKQAEWPQRIICNHYHDDDIENIKQYIQGQVVYVSDASNPAEGIIDGYPVEYVRADLVKSIQAEPVAWQPIATAPKNNERLLYLVRLNDDGTIQELAYNGTWESGSELWEIPKTYCFWASANWIEEPTHWAYQDTPPPLYSADSVRAMQLAAIRKTLEAVDSMSYVPSDDEGYVVILKNDFKNINHEEILNSLDESEK